MFCTDIKHWSAHSLHSAKKLSAWSFWLIYKKITFQTVISDNSPGTEVSLLFIKNYFRLCDDLSTSLLWFVQNIWSQPDTVMKIIQTDSSAPTKASMSKKKTKDSGSNFSLDEAIQCFLRSYPCDIPDKSPKKHHTTQGPASSGQKGKRSINIAISPAY